MMTGANGSGPNIPNLGALPRPPTMMDYAQGAMDAWGKCLERMDKALKEVDDNTRELARRTRRLENREIEVGRSTPEAMSGGNAETRRAALQAAVNGDEEYRKRFKAVEDIEIALGTAKREARMADEERRLHRAAVEFITAIAAGSERRV